VPLSNGIALEPQSTVHVRWQWTILIILQIAVSTLLLGATMRLADRRSSGSAPGPGQQQQLLKGGALLKSSTIATMCVLDEATRRELWGGASAGGMAMEYAGPEELRRKADGLLVALENGGAMGMAVVLAQRRGRRVDDEEDEERVRHGEKGVVAGKEVGIGPDCIDLTEREKTGVDTEWKETRVR